jgi:hypothetical protein
VPAETVLVEHHGSWLAGVVLWEYSDTGRPRLLVRYELPIGLIVRRLHWRDELRTPPCVVLELDLRSLVPPADAVWRSGPRLRTPGGAR